MNNGFLHTARRFKANEHGNMMIEFALIVPILLMITAIVVELGFALHQENLLEKHVSAGAALAARANYPLSTSDRTTVTNMVRTGTVNGGNDLLPGWSTGGTLQISTQTYNLNGETVPYVNVSAQVPYMPLLPKLLGFLGFNNITLSTSHEEVFVS